MAVLTAKTRSAIPGDEFAGPNRSYPIEDRNHARAALSMSAKYATPEEQARIRAKVSRRYPGMGAQKALAQAMSKK